MGRVVIAGIVGGIVVFMWGFITHVVLPIGNMGINMTATNGERAVLTAMENNMSESGMYLMPGVNEDIQDHDARKKDLQDSWAKGPVAFLVYHADGLPGMEARNLGLEGLTNVLCAMIGAMILSCVTGGYMTRVIALLLMGVFAWLSISGSYWIWYGFPTDFTIGQGIEQAGGWLIAGLAIAAIVCPKKPQSG